MSEKLPTQQIIPSAMRPSMSVVEQVKNTLLDLVSSTLSKLSNETEDPETNGDSHNTSCNGSSVVSNRSKDGYHHRLSTFTLSYWCGKPLCQSPPLLAQYGWECIGEDLIKCCSCAAIVSMRLPWSNSNNYHQQCRKAMKQIISGHMQICSWPSNCSPHSYLYPFHLKYLTKECQVKLENEFVERANNLLKLNEWLPHVNNKVIASMNISDHVMTKLINKANLLMNEAEESEENADVAKMIKVSSTLLALCGWQTICDYSASNISIQCNDTGRKIGLWNFHSIDDRCQYTNEIAEVQDVIPPKRSRQDNETKMSIVKDSFHPVNQHHVWSPWVICLKPLDPELPHITEEDEESSNDPVDATQEPGWSVLLKIILDQKPQVLEDADNSIVGEKITSESSTPVAHIRTPPKVALSAARRMLKEWSSPN
uniref:NIPA-like protein n=1 Tax=Phallusia mammillata TaxID=59560 RepID=A0A6F9DMY1_9ASCI|nr:NIPA-like protein [Phallusia mammillata]